MDALKDYLRSVIELAPADLSLLDRMSIPRHVARRHCIGKPGDISRHIYFVLSGWFRLFDVDSGGNEVNRRFTFEHEFAVDFQSFLSQKPSRYYVQAMRDAEVVAIGYSDLQAAYDQSKAWERLGRLLAERAYRQVNERMELMQFHTPEERYRFLVDSRPDLLERVSLAHLSSYLGIRPESLSRLRKRITGK